VDEFMKCKATPKVTRTVFDYREVEVASDGYPQGMQSWLDEIVVIFCFSKTLKNWSFYPF